MHLRSHAQTVEGGCNVRRDEYTARNKKEGLSLVDLRNILQQEYPPNCTRVRVEQGMRNQIKKLIIEVDDE
jgi:hypothetical protein